MANISAPSVGSLADDLQNLRLELDGLLEDRVTSDPAEYSAPGPIRGTPLYVAVQAVEQHYPYQKLPDEAWEPWREMLSLAHEADGKTETRERHLRFHWHRRALSNWVSAELARLESTDPISQYHSVESELDAKLDRRLRELGFDPRYQTLVPADHPNYAAQKEAYAQYQRGILEAQQRFIPIPFPPDVPGWEGISDPPGLTTILELGLWFAAERRTLTLMSERLGDRVPALAGELDRNTHLILDQMRRPETGRPARHAQNPTNWPEAQQRLSAWSIWFEAQIAASNAGPTANEKSAGGNARTAVNTPADAEKLPYSDPDNYDRNVWLYEQRKANRTNRDLMDELNRGKNGWNPLYDAGSVVKAADSIAEYMRWPKIRNPRGRRRSRKE